MSHGDKPMTALRTFTRRLAQGLMAALIFSAAPTFAAAPAAPVPAATEPVSADVGAEVRQIWKLLDYIAVDYVGAVKDGVVISDGEYAEMKEFGTTALTRLTGLPPRTGHDELVRAATELQNAIAGLAAPDAVARLAHEVADELLVAYPVPTAPATAPVLARGAAVYAEKCALCHGLTGNADGPAGKALDPPPIAFADAERARERSLFSLFEVATQGLADTGMRSFEKELSADDRWAVSFYAATLSASPEVRVAGEALWNENGAVRARLPNLEALVRTIESDLAREVGGGIARPVLAYLRANPEMVTQTTSADGLALARSQLAESVKAYQAGDAAVASRLALSAYLDGFEPVEGVLRTRDADLLAQVEAAMIEYRARINARAPAADVAAQAAVLNSLFSATDTTLAEEEDATATFLGAFTILLREGLEALLVVVAMIMFLGKVERRDVLPYVHAGWVAALVAGVATWFVASRFISISGAGRELTEGFAALFAAVVLLGVGIWMHQKSLAGRWQIYIREKLSTALSKKSAWVLFLLAFVAVYREVFETILFYIALAVRGDTGAIIGGLVAGIAALAVVTVILVRTSKRLPIAKFFAWSSLLIGLLAVVLAGKGVAALQEAGVLEAIPVNGPRIEVLGVYPTALPLLAQAVVLVIAIAGYYWNTRGTKPATAG